MLVYYKILNFLEIVKLSFEVREQIVDMFQKEENHSNIARALSTGRTTIKKVCLKFQETKSVIDKKNLADQKNLQWRYDYFVELRNRIRLELQDRSLTKVELIQLLQYELYSRILTYADFQE